MKEKIALSILIHDTNAKINLPTARRIRWAPDMSNENVHRIF